MQIHELETPAVIVDLDVMEDNLSRMAEYCRGQKIALRPHTKTHKIPELAARQLALGAAGITVAKIGEAEVMIRAGIKDILIAYPLVGEQKAARLADLTESSAITVALDSEDAAQAISKQISCRGSRVGVLVEVDVGYRRCGISDENDLLNLARKISSIPGLDFRGLMFFPGQFVAAPEVRARMLTEVNNLLDRIYNAFERAEVPITTVSGGSTPTAYSAHQFHGVNEIRPGMYAFNDRNMVGVGVAAEDDCALCVVCTVVSTSVPGRAIIDGGSKTFSSDRYLAGDGRSFGLVREDSATDLESLSEEHGHLNIERATRRYRVGDRISVIPNHVCSTINMHDEIYGVRGGRVETVWTVAGRGKIR